MDTLNVMLIADVGADALHSAVEGLFKTRPEIGIRCEKVFFDKHIKQPVRSADRIILPHRNRRHGLWRALGQVVDLTGVEVMIVRNLFPVLSQIQKARPAAIIGFWESFPHSHRRLEEALFEKRAVWRKRIEYFLAARRERVLIQKSSFYLPITETHKATYYPDLAIPYLATPMGFDFERYPIPDHRHQKQGPLRFVYIGAVDPLRRLDIINRAFQAQKGDFRFDYYSSSHNAAVDHIRNIDDRRIRFHDPVPQPELFREIASADVGVCFFPHTKTHITASPTKTLEYGALGLSVLVNPMPEYQYLLDDSCAFICDFQEQAIGKKIEMILATDREALAERGRCLQQRIFAQRNYMHMAKRLFGFIRDQRRTP